MAEPSDSLLREIGGVQVDDKPLDAVTVTNDGRLGASGGRDNLIRVWDMSTPEAPTVTLRLSGHTARITDLAFSPDGTLLASASADNSVHVWDALNGSLLYILDEYNDAVMSVTFSADGTLLASAGRDAVIHLNDPQTGAPLMTLDNFEQAVWALAFHPEDSYLASASEDGSVWLWGMGDNATLRQLSGHHGPVMQLIFSDNGDQLISGGMDGVIRVWTPDTGDDDPQLLRGHLAPVTGLAFIDDGYLTSASLDGTVWMWDVDTGEGLAFVTRNNLPFTALVAHESTLAVVGTEGMLTLWEVSAPPPPSPPQVVQNVAPQNVASETVVQAEQNNAPPPQDNPPLQDDAPQEQTQTTQASNPASQIVQSALPENGTFISIPVAGITSGITQFPLDGTSWAIDPWEANVGYLQGTAWLGQNGNTVLGGHSEYPNGSAGIFRNLYDVSVGDVIVMMEDGVERQYVVVELRTVHYTDLTVLYPTTHNRLTLITCDVPSFDAVSNVYYERLVVIADQVG